MRLDGLAFHLPMDRHGGYDPAAEVADWLRRLAAAGVPTSVAFVSHLTAADLAGLRRDFPGTTFRPRIGTSLWLGDRGALQARGTVLDVHRLARGTHYGYRRRRAPRDSHLVVVSGGTAHGVALEAPRTVRGPVGRSKAIAVGTLAAANLSLSPFRWAGKQRWFAEPPHMHVSLLLLPASVEPPAIGTELDCDVRLTTLHPDHVRPLPLTPPPTAPGRRPRKARGRTRQHACTRGEASARVLSMTVRSYAGQPALRRRRPLDSRASCTRWPMIAGRCSSAQPQRATP